MAKLEDIRTQIEQIDAQLKELVSKRLDCSLAIAMAKQAEGSMDVLRPEREEQVTAAFTQDAPADRAAELDAIIRKITAASRMYQYDLIYDWNPNAFETVAGHEKADRESMCVIVRFTRDNAPNALGSVLCTVGEHGFNMRRVELAQNSPDSTAFELEISGDVLDDAMRKLLFQLSRETLDFRIVGCY